ncbi:hypothetical protein IW145_004410 [Coemansia sp. RSA 521]|nr:hypothetical protein GGH17_001855 [Coemansia sp. RSA 788]KAJ2189020.1 hypothetical protein EV181_001861 [Coemansia sp. RSA 532]KAJ2202888.1 hypothetical protein IW145_004410 [Coemansia sp. RSA 521]KAJ2403844.1 hypothetical protein J3F80_005260 [Coemansia sp. RSA 2526]
MSEALDSPMETTDTSSTPPSVNVKELATILAKIDERLSSVEANYSAHSLQPKPPSAISSAPSGPTITISIQESLDMFAKYGSSFSGQGIQWSAQAWEAMLRPRIRQLPENCDPADIVAVLQGMLTGKAKKAMGGAFPVSIDDFFEQLGQCFTAAQYHLRVSQALEAGNFFDGVDYHHQAALAIQVFENLPHTDNSAVMIARALCFADEDTFVSLDLMVDEANVGNIRQWCTRYQRCVDVKLAAKRNNQLLVEQHQ